MYSKNDYRYYLDNQLAHSDDFLAHYGIKGMKWKKHKGSNQPLSDLKRMGRIGITPFIYGKDGMLRIASKTNKQRVRNEQAKGVSRTKSTDITKAQEHVNKKTKQKANMYTTQRKASYDKGDSNYSLTLSSGGKTTKKIVYGQDQKKADMKADKKMRRQAINEANPYKYDSKKSLRSNIKANKAVSDKRKRAKKKAYAKVDKEYRNV